jgi:hypothetical protein
MMPVAWQSPDLGLRENLAAMLFGNMLAHYMWLKGQSEAIILIFSKQRLLNGRGTFPGRVFQACEIASAQKTA